MMRYNSNQFKMPSGVVRQTNENHWFNDEIKGSQASKEEQKCHEELP